MRRIATLSVALGTAALGLSGCSAQSSCAVGYSAVFDLTVRFGSATEPIVRFCDTDQCSPVPAKGPVPKQLLDQSQERPALLVHTSRGEWQISPRGDHSSPSTATIELYVDGARQSTTTVDLNWPNVDPCAASYPPEPHPTVRLN